MQVVHEYSDLTAVAIDNDRQAARIRHLARTLELRDEEIRLLWNAKMDVAARHLLLEQPGCETSTRCGLLIDAWFEATRLSDPLQGYYGGQLFDAAAFRCET